MSAAASGLRTRREALDLLANKMADASSAGYKADREFYGVYSALEATDGSALPMLDRPWTDFSSGTLSPTGNPLDLALAGRGFFAVDGPGATLYTRTGAFKWSTAGVLTTAEGYAVRTVEGRPIQADPARPIEVSPEGTVRQDGAVLGRLAVVDFRSPADLTKQGATYFRASEAPAAAVDIEVQQAKLESSNVAVSESAVRMVSILRQFETLQKAIALGSEMDRRAIEEVAKVTP